MQEPTQQTDASQSTLLLGRASDTILRRTSQVILAGTLALAFLPPLHLWPIGTDNASNYTIMLVAACAWYFVNRGWSRFAAVWLTASLLLVQVANATQVAGVRTPGLLIALPVTITIAAWLGGLRAALSIAVLALLSAVGLLAAELQGMLAALTVRPPLTYGVILIVGIIVTAAVQYGSLKAFHTQFLQMREAQARSAALLHGNPVPISTLDSEGRFVDVNAAWLHTFSLARDAVLGHNSEHLDLWRDRAARSEFMALLRHSATVRDYPAWLHTPAGTTLFHIHAAHIQLNDAKHYAVTLLDQSERLAAERAAREHQELLEQRVAQRTAELRRTITQLESTQAALVQSEKLASLGALVAGVAHELNTPLGNNLMLATTIEQNVTELKEKVAHNTLRKAELDGFVQTQTEIATLVVRNAQRSADLISSFKQIAVDRTSERCRDFDLQALVNDTWRALQPSLRQQAVQVTLAVDSGIACHGYPGAAGQILTNLIQNAALHAFGAGGGAVTVRGHCAADHRIVLEVQDDGCGMDEATARKVFDPFFTTKLGQGGSGLGLSIAYNLAVGTLHGSLRVHTAPGQGSCFRLEFPQHLQGSTATTA